MSLERGFRAGAFALSWLERELDVVGLTFRFLGRRAALEVPIFVGIFSHVRVLDWNCQTTLTRCHPPRGAKSAGICEKSAIHPSRLAIGGESRRIAVVMGDIRSRKADHLELAATADVGFRRKTNLFECVELIHNALPELDFDSLDTSVTVLGKRLRAPLCIAGMTGGTERAANINAELSALAEECGYAFGLGSQRAMMKKTELAKTFQVRAGAPNTLILGNIGAVQARDCGTPELEELVGQIGADALCVHLNPAMELVQSDGDRDFRGIEETFRRLTNELSVPVVAKETGCGLSRSVAQRLVASGVRHVDVSGAGGTSWVAVETHRAEPGRRPLGERFWDWGVPTAASVAVTAKHFRTVFATGGMSDGLEAAKAIALGATVVGMARPVLIAFEEGGRSGARTFFQQVELELKMAMLLVGAANLSQLMSAPRVMSDPLRQWLSAQGIRGDA